MHQSLVAVAVAFVIGIRLQQQVSLEPQHTWACLAALSLMAAVAHFLSSGKLATRLLILAVLTAGLLRGQQADPLLDGRHYLHQLGEGPVVLTVRLDEEPRLYQERAVCVAQVLSTGAGREAVGRIRLVLRGVHWLIPGYGDVFQVSGEVAPIIPDRFSETWSWKHAQLNAGVLSELSCRPGYYRRQAIGEGNRLVAWAHGTRRRFSDLLSATHEKGTANLLKQLVLGERSVMPAEQIEDFRQTGTLHALSQSGQHIGILALVCYFVFGLLPIGRRLPALATLVVLAAYALMVGGRPSILRALVMAACVVAGALSERKTSPFNGVALAALLILIHDPRALETPGFQLSFAATLSILALTPALMHLLSRFPTHGSSLVSVSTAAFIGTAPLLLVYFGSIPVIALVANLFVMPLIAILMPMALLSLLVGLISVQLAYIFAAANFGFASVLLEGLRVLAEVPLASLDLPAPGGSAVLLYYLVIIVAGDHRALSLKIASRRPADQPTAPSGDWSWMLGNRPMDPMMSRLEEILGQLPPTQPSPEDLERVRLELGADLADELDPLTLNYLGFASRQRSGTQPDAAAAAAIGYLMAVERELDSRIFRFLDVPDEVARSEVARTHRRGHIGRAPRSGRDVLCLPLQSELLWFHLVPTGRETRTLVEAFSQDLKEGLRNPEQYLDPSGLALSLDRLLKQYHGPVCAGETLSHEAAEAASREVCGFEAEPGLLQRIVEAGSLASSPGPKEESPVQHSESEVCEGPVRS